MNNLSFYMTWLPMYLDYEERMHHHGPWEYFTPCNCYNFSFRIEILGWYLRVKSTSVWNHEYEIQALDASLFPKQ